VWESVFKLFLLLTYSFKGIPMSEDYYPWGGEFIVCNNKSCVAVVLLNLEFTPSKKVAIYGPLKTENIGIEKIVANVISNPNIRYIVICGNDIRGHRSGSSLVALKNNGIDKNNRIIDAPGAIPYIENLKEEAIDRFQNQIEIVDLIGVSDINTINKKIDECIRKSPTSYGKPYIAIKIKQKSEISLDDKRVIHSRITIDYMGRINKRGE
jgi:tetrahydromethanopterin S-methyltransferase subunit A